MGSFGGQTKWRGAWGEERWVNSFSNGVLICRGNLQRAAPGCASWDDERWGDSVAVIISGIIDQTAAPAELEKDDGFGGSSPAKTCSLSGDSQGLSVSMWKKESVRSARCCSVLSCKTEGVLAIVQKRLGGIWQMSSISCSRWKTSFRAQISFSEDLLKNSWSISFYFCLLSAKKLSSWPIFVLGHCRPWTLTIWFWHHPYLTLQPFEVQTD